MQSADADVIQMNKAIGGITLNNYGSMISLNASKGGAQAIDFNAIVSSSNTINNFATGLLKAIDADAVRPGANGVVNNYGNILSVVTTDPSSDGIDFQNNSGITVNNVGAGSFIDGARHGITGGAATATTLNWTAPITNGGTIRGNNGSGINLDGFNANQVVTITNTGTIVGTGVTGDGDGIDVDGIANITNSGIIRSANSFSALAGSPGYSEGITIGGGTVINSGTIEGLVSAGNSNALGRGITLSGNDIAGSTTGAREGLYGNAIVVNNAGGLIRGQNDSAIVVEGLPSAFAVSITNNATATIRGGSSSLAAIRTGADAATITNRGTIDGSSSNAAIAGGAGTLAVNILGSQASVIGGMNGGTSGNSILTMSPGNGATFSYGGSISNFASVQVQSGQVTLSGASTYSGTTKISGGNLTLDGANRLSSQSALSLAGGRLTLANAGGANGQTFSSLLLSDNSSIDLGNSSLTFYALGNVANGKSLTLFDYAVSLSPEYAIRILGDVSGMSDFQALIAGLTINGVGASFRFDGTYTNIGAVPLPPSFALFLAGLSAGCLLLKRRALA
jgi:autotransporter-associated beta strand protein